MPAKPREANRGTEDAPRSDNATQLPQPEATGNDAPTNCSMKDTPRSNDAKQQLQPEATKSSTPANLVCCSTINDLGFMPWRAIDLWEAFDKHWTNYWANNDHSAFAVLVSDDAYNLFFRWLELEIRLDPEAENEGEWCKCMTAQGIYPNLQQLVLKFATDEALIQRVAPSLSDHLESKLVEAIHRRSEDEPREDGSFIIGCKLSLLCTLRHRYQILKLAEQRKREEQRQQEGQRKRKADTDAQQAEKRARN